MVIGEVRVGGYVWGGFRGRGKGGQGLGLRGEVMMRGRERLGRGRVELCTVTLFN